MLKRSINIHPNEIEEVSWAGEVINTLGFIPCRTATLQRHRRGIVPVSTLPFPHMGQGSLRLLN